MRTGGSERFISNIVTHIDTNYFDLTLILIKKEGDYLKVLPKSLKVVDLKCKRVRESMFKIMYYIYNYKPDVVFSTVSHLNIYLGIIRFFFDKKIKFIARESNTISERIKNQKNPLMFRILYHLFYNNYDIVIAQSISMKQDLVDNFGLNRKKIKIIYNPVDIDYIQKKISSENTNFNNNCLNLLAVGSLEYQKGFDLLINAASLIKVNFQLFILGSGSLFIELRKLRDELGLSSKVTFFGNIENPFAFMKHADFLVLSSRFEGLPNVVLEANACGTPVIAYNSPGGTAEIVKHGINGILIDKLDAITLARGIDCSQNYDFSKKQIIDNARNNHSIKKIIPQIISLF